MTGSYHCHTTWSDGVVSVAEMVIAAKKAGLDEVGISDHYVLMPGNKTVPWSMPLEKLSEYVEEIRSIASRQTGIIVRLGLEADYFPETVQDLKHRLQKFDFDYIIGSVHFIDHFPVDESSQLWDSQTEQQRDELWIKYWQKVKELARSRIYTFLAHPDLPKRFGHRATRSMQTEENSALDALKEAGMGLEINTAGWRLPVKEAYPTMQILQAARKRDIPLYINADAHGPDMLTYEFPRARELASKAGYSAEDIAGVVPRQQLPKTAD